jgi:hypothetical protein
MLVLSKPYTDRHGIVFQKAVLVVTAINFAVSNSGSYVVNKSTPAISYNLINQNSSMNVGFTASLYASETALENNREGMEFKDVNGQPYFNLSLPADTDPQTLVSLCEAHLLTVVSQ